MSELMVGDPTLGLERVGRECLVILMDVLNDELASQDAEWAPLDEELADLRGVTYEPIVLEEIEPQNFHLGHRPSLINAAIDAYPNVCCMADRADDDDDGHDQLDSYSDKLWVEVMVKSEKDEQEVNARIQRTADAVNICILSNRDLRGVVQEIQGPPSVQIGELFTRAEREAHGKEWFWQGARLEYAVKKEAAMPSGSGSRPASIRPSALAAAGGIPNIDQS